MNGELKLAGGAKEKCIIWGIGKMGSSWLLKEMLQKKYNIAAYCDNKAGKDEVNGICFVSANNIKEYIKSNNISTIVIGVRDKENVECIKNQIRHEISQSVKILSFYSAEMDEIENEYLIDKHNALQFKCNVDFDKQSEIWVENIINEVTYWIKTYSKTKGDFVESYIQNNDFLKFAPMYESFSNRLCDNDRILDIGSGIVSKFGSVTPKGCEVEICAIDPLAYYYNQMLPKDLSKDILEKKKCHFGLFELIANFYEKDSVDGIIINNALDHCIDPFKAIVESLYILKKDKYIGTVHRRAEAVFEKYTGLHRWNIDYNSKNHFIIWNEDNAVDVTETLKGIADIKIDISNENLSRERQQTYIEIRKKEDFRLEEFVDLQRERISLAKLIENLMKYFAQTDISDILKKLNKIKEGQFD